MSPHILPAPPPSSAAVRWAFRLLLLALLSLLAASCTATGPADVTDLSLLIVGGNGQSGPAGAELPLPLTVKAVGAGGEVLRGIVVNFRVTSGGGSVFAGSALTNRDGLASDYWTLGFDSAPQLLEVRGVSPAGTKEVFARFSAAVTGGGVPARIVSQAGDSQVATVGTAVAIPPAVRLTDTLGQPWMGVPVVFEVLSGGGSVTGDTVFTDSGGVAAVGSWTLGPAAGANTLRAMAQRSGIAGNPVLFSAQGMQTDTRPLAANGFHSCGLVSGGIAYCWGSNSFGQLGDGTTTLATTPVAVQTTVRFRQLTGGLESTCGLSLTGAPYCWGYNAYGELGDGTSIERHTPTAVVGALMLTALSGSVSHTCGLDFSGKAYCWGSNSHGELGRGDFAPTFVPVPVAGGLQFSSIVVGMYHTCAIAVGGRAYCWGLNADGQVGDGSYAPRNLPTAVASVDSFTMLTAGGGFSCGLSTNLAAECWGFNSAGQLGDGTRTSRPLPGVVATAVRFISIVSASGHTCGLTSGGSGYCWGGNFDGSIGDGTTMTRSVPTPVSGGLVFSSLSAGQTHTCGVVVGVAYCWGSNQEGQLGIPTAYPDTVLVPTAVAGGLTFPTTPASAAPPAGAAGSAPPRPAPR